ncbi:DUF1735 domain-containing protein [Pedobacter sp. Leaf170]|uniref:DUF1735 domain-containing protein n=1 Tax=Pedobacter sp. Leaf170 TaxID=2876558 RepID=UPI001E4664F2|nr:DUF1735 domain-containing protein [Pedobacter sp. Leaf170]
MKKIIFNSLLALTIATTLSSCLKDSVTDLDPSKGVNVIEFANPAAIVKTGAPYSLYTFAYATTETPSLPITVSYSGPQEFAPQDITVNIGLAPASTIDTYNTAIGTTYSMLNGNGFTFTGTSVVIKQGTNKATFTIPLKPGQFDFSKQEVLPITISSASSGVISGNFRTILLNVNAKNAYDGIYTPQEGSFVQRYSNPTTPTTGDALNGPTGTNPDVTLTTVSLTTVQIGNLRWSGGSSGVGGIDNLQATVDPATNLVTMKALGNATLANIPGSVNRYDPATKTFTLNFDWNQTSTKRVYSLKIKYKGSR